MRRDAIAFVIASLIEPPGANAGGGGGPDFGPESELAGLETVPFAAPAAASSVLRSSAPLRIAASRSPRPPPKMSGRGGKPVVAGFGAVAFALTTGADDTGAGDSDRARLAAELGLLDPRGGAGSANSRFDSLLAFLLLGSSFGPSVNGSDRRGCCTRLGGATEDASESESESSIAKSCFVVRVVPLVCERRGFWIGLTATACCALREEGLLLLVATSSLGNSPFRLRANRSSMWNSKINRWFDKIPGTATSCWKYCTNSSARFCMFSGLMLLRSRCFDGNFGNAFTLSSVAKREWIASSSLYEYVNECSKAPSRNANVKNPAGFLPSFCTIDDKYATVTRDN